MGLPAPQYITDANLLVDGQRLTVFATHVLDLPDAPGKIAQSLLQAAVSEDGGATWSAPKPVPVPHKYVCGCVHAPVWLADRGRSGGDTVVMGYSWDVPAEEGKPASDEGGMYLKAGVLISHDRGRTWTPGGDVEVPHHPIGADEPALVRLSNGDLFAILRTSYPRPYETRSRDGGLTWEPLQPSAFHGYNSPAALLRLRDGAILRAWDNSPTERFPLVVALSTDDCHSFTPPRTVTEPTAGPDGKLSFRTACYPTLAQAADGTILMAWWQVDPGEKFTVRYARFNRAWVEATPAGPRAKVVAFGDSVTLGARPGVTEYQTFRHLLQQRLTQQGLPIQVTNAGLGGNNTNDALVRLQSDVLAERPALAIVMFGINDAAMVDGGPTARTEPRVALPTCVANLKAIIGRLREAKVKVLLCTPTPMSRTYVHQNIGAYAEHEDINYLLRQYAGAARQVAAEMNVEMVDLFRLFTQRPDGLDLIEDGNHPFVKGHALIADALTEPVRKLLRPGGAE